jgi:hypothetical protein
VSHEERAKGAGVEIAEELGPRPPGVSDIARMTLGVWCERGVAVWAGDRDAVAAAATAARLAITGYPFWDDSEAAAWYVGGSSEKTVFVTSA